jgi:hypothetical protein
VGTWYPGLLHHKWSAPVLVLRGWADAPVSADLVDLTFHFSFLYLEIL